MLKSRANRLVWAINGYLLLLILCLALLEYLSESGFPWTTPDHHERGLLVGDAAETARRLDISAQHLQYDRPDRVANSPYYMAPVYVLDKEIPREIKEMIAAAGDLSMGLIGARINVLFFRNDRSDVRRLLEENGYIHLIDAPRVAHRAGRPIPETREHIVYRIAMTDTNGDDRINEEDDMAYYLSDLAGRNLTRITPLGLDLSDYWFSDDFSEIYFEEIIEDPAETVAGRDFPLKERRLYFYEIESGRFGAFDELEEAFGEIQAAFKSQT